MCQNKEDNQEEYQLNEKELAYQRYYDTHKPTQESFVGWYKTVLRRNGFGSTELNLPKETKQDQ